MPYEKCHGTMLPCKSVQNKLADRFIEGIFRKNDDDDVAIDVAIKSPILCQSDRSRLEKELKDVYGEAKVSSSFMHENILHCLGVSRGR